MAYFTHLKVKTHTAGFDHCFDSDSLFLVLLCYTRGLMALNHKISVCCSMEDGRKKKR